VSIPQFKQFSSTACYEVHVVQNHRPVSECRKTCCWLSVSWKPGLVEMISIDHMKSCSGFTNVVTCSVIILFQSFTASQPSVCTGTFRVPLHIIWTVHIGVIILGIELVLPKLTYENKTLLRKIQKISKVTIFMIRTSGYCGSVQTKGEIYYAWQSAYFT